MLPILFCTSSGEHCLKTNIEKLDEFIISGATPDGSFQNERNERNGYLSSFIQGTLWRDYRWKALQMTEFKSNTHTGIFRSLTMKPLENLGVLGLGAFFHLVTYLLPMVGRKRII